MYIGVHVKYPLFLSYFNENWIFSTHFLKIDEFQTSWKSFQWLLICSMRTDGRTHRQTYMTKIVVCFRNFANALKTIKNARSLAWLLIGDSPKRNMLSSLEHQTIAVVAIVPRSLRNPIMLLSPNSTRIENEFSGCKNRYCCLRGQFKGFCVDLSCTLGRELGEMVYR
jgi:hypothetical protein